MPPRRRYASNANNNSNTDRDSESENSMNHGLYNVVPSKSEFHRECVLLRKDHAPSKGGLGVFANRDIPGWSQLLVYPGRVYYNKDWNRAYRDAAGKTTRAYAIGFFRLRPDNTIRRDLTLDPSPPHDGTVVDWPFRKYCGPFVNEPAPGERPNAVWVLDVPAQKLCLYSYEGGIRKDQEVMVCYGPGYVRSYRTSCTASGWRPTKSTLGSANAAANKYDVHPGMSYQRMYEGMRAQFMHGNRVRDFDLARVHPRGWFQTAPMLRTFFGSRPVGYRVPRVSRTFPDTDQLPCARTMTKKALLQRRQLRARSSR
jgi:hypothetical protein